MSSIRDLKDLIDGKQDTPGTLITEELESLRSYINATLANREPSLASDTGQDRSGKDCIGHNYGYRAPASPISVGDLGEVDVKAKTCSAQIYTASYCSSRSADCVSRSATCSCHNRNSSCASRTACACNDQASPFGQVGNASCACDGRSCYNGGCACDGRANCGSRTACACHGRTSSCTALTNCACDGRTVCQCDQRCSCNTVDVYS